MGWEKPMPKTKNFNILLACAILLIGAVSSTAGLEKKYALVYFRYLPTDLGVEITTDGPTADSGDQTDYILPRIDASTGDARFFLVQDSPLEREKFDTVYRYRMIFYKTQKIDGRVVKVPVYSFRLGFDGDNLSVRYEDGSTNSFTRSIDSGAYILRDNNGQDFDLSERMRPVKFTAWLRKVADGVTNYTPLDPAYPLELLLVRKEAENDIRTGDSASVPAGKEITVGLSPYIISNADVNERFRVRAVLVGSNEQPEPVVHFAEAWKNLYEQRIVVEDDGSWADISFDDGLCQLRYSLTTRRIATNISVLTNSAVLTNVTVLTNTSVSNALDAMSNVVVFTNTAITSNCDVTTNVSTISNVSVVTNIKDSGSFSVEKSPFSFSLRALDGKSVSVAVTAKDYALRYLERATEKIAFDVSAAMSGTELLRQAASNYSDSTRILSDGSLLVNPSFGKSPFAVLSTPENAKIFVRRTEPVPSRSTNVTLDLGQSPAFFPALEYGRYRVTAEWYDRSNAQIVTRRAGASVELSSYGTFDRTSEKRELPLIAHGDTKIPYIQFRFENAIPVKPVSNQQAAATNSASASEGSSSSVSIVKKTRPEPVQWIVEPVKKAPSIQGPSYYIQLAAFRKTESNWRFKAANFLNAYLTSSRVKNGIDHSRECRFAEKIVKGSRYAIIVQGPYSLETAREEVVHALELLPQAFLVGPDAIRVMEQ
jgi:hypothetical protein